jgi:hypothetical protein
MAYIYDLTDTWNAGGTTFNAIKLNVTDSASASPSKLVTLQTNGTEQFSVTKAGVGYFSGNVGIGTTSAAYQLQVKGLGQDTAALTDAGNKGGSLYLQANGVTSGSGGALLFGTTFGNGTPFAAIKALVTDGGTNTTGDLAFSTRNSISDTALTERMRLALNGNVGIGTSAPSFKLDVGSFSTASTQTIQVAAASANDAQIKLMEAANTFGFTIRNANGSGLNFLRHSADATGTTAMFIGRDTGNVGIGTSSPNYLLDLQRDSGVWELIRIKNSTATASALITATGSGGGSVDFGCGAAASTFIVRTASAERMRIDSSGNLLVGTTSSFGKVVASQSGSADVFYAGIGASGSAFTVAGTASTMTVGYFVTSSGLAGSITCSGTATSYNTSSDVRLKHDIVDAPDAASLIDAIQVRSFKWNADNSEQRYGFVAQELVTVAPEAVHRPVNSEDMMAVDYSKLVPMLVKELQSLRARVAQLEGN